jgi:hypothetical protein
MRWTIFILVGLVPILAASLFYGWIEGGANMVEMLVLPLTSEDPSSGGALWLGAPIVAICLLTLGIVMVAVPLAASALTASIAGWGLRQSHRQPFPKRAVAPMVALCAMVTTGFLLLATQAGHDHWLPDRPDNRPKTPALILALVAGSNAGLGALAAAMILCAIGSRASPKPPELTKPETKTHKET